MYDDFETLAQDDGAEYFESFACATRYNLISLADMSSLNVWGLGFRGKELLKDASGKHDTID
jgi:hypothetical protein